MSLLKRQQEELRALGIDTPDDGSDPGDPEGGVLQARGGQIVISTNEEGWRKRYLEALHPKND